LPGAGVLKEPVAKGRGYGVGERRMGDRIGGWGIFQDKGKVLVLAVTWLCDSMHSSKFIEF
jgi:hypothetical protein